MTLLIACFCVYGFHLDPAWYVASAVLWFIHLAVHEGTRTNEWAWLKRKLGE